MATTTLASVAAATAAGYERVQIDFGDQSAYPQADSAPKGKRYATKLTKRQVGTFLTRIEAYGESDTSAAAADTAALASLNEQRNQRYGYDTTALRKDTYGATQTVDA